MSVRSATRAAPPDRSHRPGAGEASPARLTIRPASREDVQPLAELFRQEAEIVLPFDPAVRTRQGADWAQYVAAQLQHPQTMVLVAQYKTRLVGFIAVRVVRQGGRPSWPQALRRRLFRRPVQEADLVARTGTLGFIEHVYVDAAVRMLGVFKKLFEAGMDWLRDHGATEVEGVIWAGNESALDLFRKLGFEPVRYLMRKRL